MNTTILRGINSDITSIRQYLGLASRTADRALSTIQIEQVTATPEERQELERIADQCRAERKLINAALDGIQGVDKINIPEAAACIS
jgi:wyosine [tRNA(Phe)-imidazoG37] synthetase (radical SAM superfamily)